MFVENVKAYHPFIKQQIFSRMKTQYANKNELSNRLAKNLLNTKTGLLLLFLALVLIKETYLTIQ